MGARLREKYADEIVPALMKRFGYVNRSEVPALEKVVVNVGVGEAIQTPKLLEGVTADLMAITGQRPCIRGAKKSISIAVKAFICILGYARRMARIISR